MHQKGRHGGSAVGLGQPRRASLDDPDFYDVTHEMEQMLAFGHGVHFCLGAHLARLEGIVCLQEVMKRLGDFEIKADAAVRMCPRDALTIES